MAAPPTATPPPVATVASQQTAAPPPAAAAAPRPAPKAARRDWGGFVDAEARVSAPAAAQQPALPGLRLSGAQLFVGNFVSPDTPYERLLVQWQTGVGKSIAAIRIADGF